MLLLVLRTSFFLTLALLNTTLYATDFASYTLPPGWKKFDFVNPANQLSVYYGETLRLPVELSSNNEGLVFFQQMDIPFGYLEAVTSNCPAPDSPIILFMGTCYYNLVLTGNTLGQCFSGRLRHEISSMHWGRRERYSSTFSYCVLPHSLSFLNIPEQEATANLPFSLSLLPFTAAYQENVMVGAKPVFQIESEQNTAELSDLGLSFDANSGQLSGRLTETGVFGFKVGASNTRSRAADKVFWLKVSINPHDKPRFRANPSLAAATAGKDYKVDLSSLLEDNPSFARSNQLSFAMDESTRSADTDWLKIKENTHLYGAAPMALAGASVFIRITASSNTGGVSAPADLRLKIAENPLLRPRIKEGLQLTAEAGESFYFDLQEVIEDDTRDPALKLILESATPEASWISIDKTKALTLSGTVPKQAAGQLYQLRLHANNQAGGDSETAVALLSIKTNPLMKPIFKAGAPQLPEVVAGQPYFYDFRASRDVYPEYEEAPFTLRFKDLNDAPPWLRLENNQLLSDEVPEVALPVVFELVIHNSAGGDSDSYYLTLR